MRFLHVSDLHIGKSFYHQDPREFLDLQEDLLRKVIQKAQDLQCDALVIAGDIYDRQDPGAEAVAVLDRFMNRLKDSGLTVLMIAGNHDSPKKLGYARSFLEDRDIYLETVYDGAMRAVELEGVVFHLLPFIKPFSTAGVLGTRPASFQDMMEQVLARQTLDPDKAHVLISHQFVSGATTCESESVMVGGLDEIAADTFRDYDYVAMGHLHSPQRIGDNVWYPGTLQRLSISELNQKKGALVVDVDPSALPGMRVKVEPVSIEPLRGFEKLSGTLAELTDPVFVASCDRNAYVYAALQDEQPNPLALMHLQECWPRLVGLGYEALEARVQEAAGVAAAVRSEDPADNIREFYRSQNGQDLNERQEALLSELLEEMEAV